MHHRKQDNRALNLISIYFSICAVCGLFLGSNTVSAFSGSSDSISSNKVFKMRINRGKRITNKPGIEVQILPTSKHPSMIAGMRIGFDRDLQSLEWKPFKPKVLMKIEGGDGLKTVYVQLKDVAGNVSPTNKASIILDQTPPINCKIVINEDEEFTNAKSFQVKLKIEAEGAYKMQLSSSKAFTNATWTPIVASKYWQLLPKVDGVKYVYARFKDIAGNVSDVFQDSIIVDTTPPDGSVVINDDDEFTVSRMVYLKIKTNDAVQVRIVGPHSRVLPFEKRHHTHDFMLQEWWFDSIQGKKVIKVYFKDRAGNITKVPAQDEILLDENAPEKPLINYNNGAQYCTAKDGKVNLKVGSRGNPSNFIMYMSNDPFFENAVKTKYKNNIDGWVLDKPDQDGKKTVYVKFEDEAGNTSETAAVQIILDREAPIAKSIIINDGQEWTTSPYVKVNIDAENAVQMDLSNSSNFTSSETWEPYDTVRRDWQILGEYGVNKIYARFRDKAGNISKVIVGQVSFDNAPPSKGKIFIEGGSPFLNKPELKVHLELEYEQEAYEMCIANSIEELKQGNWQPVQPVINDWQLAGTKDGVKNVFVVFRDQSKNMSEVTTASIKVDRQGPINARIIINNDSAYLTDQGKKVNLTLFAEGAQYMKVGNKSDLSDAQWKNYQSYLNDYILPGDDGEKVVYAQFKDEAGNATLIVEDKIILDREPPIAKSFVVNNGENWVNDPEKRVMIQVEAVNASAMMISHDPKFRSAKWRPYATIVNDYTLYGEDGLKEIYVIFRDESGNTSDVLKTQINLKRSF